MKLPNFLCIGAQKAGTTRLYEILRRQAGIFLPRHKEIHYFDIEDNYARGKDWYAGFFADAGESPIIGEMTPIYLFYEHIAERIKNDLGGDVKLLILLRNPVDRAYSHYWMSFRRRHEKLSFDAAILREQERLRAGDFERRHFSYVSRGYYLRQMEVYLRHFPRENLHVVLFEELLTSPVSILARLADFLGCDPVPAPADTDRVHAGELRPAEFLRGALINSHDSSQLVRAALAALAGRKKFEYPPMQPSTRKYLAELYEPENRRLASFLGRSLSPWRENSGESRP